MYSSPLGYYVANYVPSNFMANRRVPKFSWNNCAQSYKKTFMCPKFRTNPVLKYTKCHISTNLSNFLKQCLLYCQKFFALAPTNRWFAEKNWLSGNTGCKYVLDKAFVLSREKNLPNSKFVVLSNFYFVDILVYHIIGNNVLFKRSYQFLV